MAAELGKAYVQIVPSAQGIGGSISSVLAPEATSAGQQAGTNIAGGISTALKGAAGIVAAGTAAMTGAIVKGTSDVASYGDNIDKMSQKMGLSAQAYQEWDAVMQHSGTSMEAMKASMKTLANAAQTNNAAFEELGITQEQLATMSQEQLFEATIAALQNVEDTTTRTYLAGKTLGKGATELGALLNTSAEDTQAMRDRVRELGGVMSDDAVKAAAAFQDNLQDMQTAISGVGRNMMSELLPSMNEIIAGFTSLIIGEEGATQKLSSGFQNLFSSLDGIAKNIISTITQMMPDIINGITEVLPDLIEVATTLIVSLAQALVSAMPQLLTTVLPALAEAAVNIIVALGNALIESAPELFAAGEQLFEMLKESFVSGDALSAGTETIQNILDGITAALPNVLSKGVEIITNLANGILNNLPQLITTAGQLMTQFASFLLQNMPVILEQGAQLILNLVTGITNNLPEIINSVAEIIASFVETIASNLPTILAQGITIIGKLAAGLIQAIPSLVGAIPQIIQAIVNAFGGYDWASIGRNILEGIKNGILSAVDSVVEAAKGAGEAIWNGVKDFFQIESPSKLMFYAGEMIDAGLARGIEQNVGLVDSAIDSLSNRAMADLNVSTTYGSVPQVSSEREAQLDAVVTMLGNYLPVIAEKEGIDFKTLYNGINRQMGWALS